MKILKKMMMGILVISVFCFAGEMTFAGEIQEESLIVKNFSGIILSETLSECLDKAKQICGDDDACFKREKEKCKENHRSNND